MKFAMAYSGGKDCTLAFDKMLDEGHECVCFVVTIGKNIDYSFMHILTTEHFENISRVLGIPVIFARTEHKYDEGPIIEAFTEAKEKFGAEAVCTGDIDYEQARIMNEQLAKKAGLKVVMPLWGKSHEDCVHEIIKRGYICYVKAIDTNFLSESLLGKKLDEDVLAIIKKSEADICGENGEYHTVLTYMPRFAEEVPFYYDRLFRNDNLSYLIIGPE